MRAIRLLLLAVLFLVNSEAYALSAKLRGVRSFCFGIGSNVLSQSLNSLVSCDLVVLDGEEATAEQVDYLRTNGSVVLAYLSVGTIEIGRSWYSKVSRFKLELWGDWGEYYADVSKEAYRRVIDRSVSNAMLKKGFDGLFLDNVDMITSHRKQTEGMKLLVQALSTRVKRKGKLLFTQNGDAVIGKFTRYLDGWNREDFTSTYSFESQTYGLVPSDEHSKIANIIQKLLRKGLLVTTTDYVATGDSASEAQSLSQSCLFGAIPFVSDIDLNRMPVSPYTCEK